MLLRLRDLRECSNRIDWIEYVHKEGGEAASLIFSIAWMIWFRRNSFVYGGKP